MANVEKSKIVIQKKSHDMRLTFSSDIPGVARLFCSRATFQKKIILRAATKKIWLFFPHFKLKKYLHLR
jgi:hypothetical protein